MRFAVFNDGSSKDLVNLSGTIPIVYKSKCFACVRFVSNCIHVSPPDNTYNIPVCIWLMDTHPNNAPICYVQPTAEMGIRVSMHVDCNGKIYLPYLHEWTPSTSELVVLIQIMIVTFGDTPPVFKITRDSGYKPSYTGPSSGAGMSYRMPYPPNAVGQPASYLPYPTGGAAAGGPAPGQNFPPYPMTATGAYPHPVPPHQQPQGAPYPIGGAVGMPGNGYVSNTNVNAHTN